MTNPLPGAVPDLAAIRALLIQARTNRDLGYDYDPERVLTAAVDLLAAVDALHQERDAQEAVHWNEFQETQLNIADAISEYCAKTAIGGWLANRWNAA